MDQKQVVVYVERRNPRCWATKRLLRRKGYALEVVDVSVERGSRAWLVRTTGRNTLPQVFVDGRLVGDFGVIRSLESSGNLDRLVRGEV